MKVCQQVIVHDLCSIRELFKLDCFLPVTCKGENFKLHLMQRLSLCQYLVHVFTNTLFYFFFRTSCSSDLKNV